MVSPSSQSSTSRTAGRDITQIGRCRQPRRPGCATTAESNQYGGIYVEILVDGLEVDLDPNVVQRLGIGGVQSLEPCGWCEVIPAQRRFVHWPPTSKGALRLVGTAVSGPMFQIAITP